ncbi:unnamed protein product [Moneuplotes crassus]|uniref:Sidoreflexin n=1 Tax=Euplotes crassus TaxID=5936 RepID=A0AAD2CZ92_EUPCR|nr:unnamed protein product [Moneuplotes crassus]
MAHDLHPNKPKIERRKTTYWERVKILSKTQNPFNFYLPHSTIEKARDLVYNLDTSQNILDKEEVERAKNIVKSAYHPETGELIPRPMRLCSYATMLIPVNFGLLLAKPTIFNTIFWHWFNQTYSAGVNYSNRSISGKFTNKDLITAYCAAIISSISVGLGMRKLLTPIAKKFHGPSQIFINFIVNLSAVGSAGFCNLLIMRSKEMRDGIILRDHEGKERGVSKITGKKAVLRSAITRFLMPIPPLLLPTLTFYTLERLSLMPKAMFPKMLTQIIIFFIFLACGPTFACALFQQEASTSVSGLESHFQNLIDSSNADIKILFYNKGL